MLFALAEPLSELGLIVAFLTGVVVRAGARSVLATRLVGGRLWGRPAGAHLARRLLDPFGALAAAFGGTGWGRAGVGLVCFGMIALLPVPPCDGAGALWLLWRRPGPHAARVRHWLVERNVGVAILLVAMVPLGARGALAYPVLDALGTPLVRLW